MKRRRNANASKIVGEKLFYIFVVLFLHNSGTLRRHYRWCFFDRILPHYKLFETQAQFIVVTEELGVRWDLIQEDLGHLQRALEHGEEREEGKGKHKETRVRETKTEKAKQKSGARKERSWERKCLRANEQKEG